MREITQEEWNEMCKLREPTLEQLEFFANLCNHKDVTAMDGYVIVSDAGYNTYDPLNNDLQNHRLLEAVIKGKDCRLFHDDGVDEYFIYQGYAENNPPVAHRTKLNEVVLEAALELYFPTE